MVVGNGISSSNSSIDTQNDAIFEAGDTFSKPSFLVYEYPIKLVDEQSSTESP